MQLPQYTKKDLLIMAVNLPPVVLLINSLLFGKRFFTEWKVFAVSGLIVLAIMTVTWFGFTWVAVTVRSRLPSSKDLIRRLGITIALIAFIQALVMTLIFRGYDHFNLLEYELNETRYYWTLAVGFVVNIIITMLHEGFESFERWKATLTETEQLKKAYTQSQLLGLKSQVNPHFLFNSLNSLSSLISEDEEKAEVFLNELTKVYRYMLRSSDEQLVTLETELQFIHSYFYLLKARYGESVRLNIEVEESRYNKYISPLLLQTIIEYGFNSNMLSKENPLEFWIAVDNGRLQVKNNLNRKQHAAAVSMEAVHTMVDKYKLLGAEPVSMSVDDSVLTVSIPLLNEYVNHSE